MIPLDRYPVLLLDMNSTFMFGEDRFGPTEDFHATYRARGGTALSAEDVSRAVRSAYAYLDARYADPAYEDDFPSVAEAFLAVAPDLSDAERALLEATFAYHELGVVPPDYADALRTLSARHELRLLTNIWAPKAPWVVELARVGVLTLFERAVFSSDTRSIKPSLRLVQEALVGTRCGRHEILMVGDSIARDLRAGRRAGLATLWVSAAEDVPPSAANMVDFRVPSLLTLVADARVGGPVA
jgi:FMN phosphatase YigB (HAD superfamily)